jgi:hypothetical protein
MKHISTVCLTLPILGLNGLIDQGKYVSIDEMHTFVEFTDVFSELEKRFGRVAGFEVLSLKSHENDRIAILEILQRMGNANASADFNVQNNGIALLLGMLNELLQQASSVTILDHH